MGRRERYLTDGPRTLGDAELVALVLETGAGGRSSLVIAADLLDRAGGIGELGRMEPHEWLGVVGMGEARAVRVHAAIELGRRVVGSRALGAPIQSPDEAFAVLGPSLRDLGHEELHGLYLDRRHRPLAC
ncbi:MAG: UPF0758 domain-containing protein, partial [Myxococcota bacterium]